MDMQIHNIRAARKVAGTINTLKTLTVVLVTLGTVFPALGALSGEQEPLGLGLLFIGGLMALTVFATFGWFEHTLNLLCDIAFEAASAGEAANPGQGEATA